MYMYVYRKSSYMCIRHIMQLFNINKAITTVNYI